MRTPRTLGPYAERFLIATRHRCKWRTWQTYEHNLRNHVVPAVGPDTPLANITRAVLRDFIADRRAAGYAGRTVHLMFKTLRALLSSALDEELIEANPALRLSRAFPRHETNPRDKALPRAHLERFLTVARRRHPRIGALLFVLARCGLRLGEGLALRWDAVDLDARLIHVRHGLDYRHHLDTPKSGRTRTVDLSGEATLCLLALREKAGPAVPWVFPGRGGRPWSRTRVRNVILEVLEEADLPRRYRAHALRHSFASLLADAGTSPWIIRDLLGHADLTTTQLYVQLRERHLETVDRLDGHELEVPR